MTLDPRPAAPPAALQETRQRATRQATALSGGVMVFLGGLFAIAAVGAFIILDYQFQAGPKLIFKLFAAVGGAAFLVLKPRAGLFLIPTATMFMTWIPPSPIPGVNVMNILSFGVFTVWALGRVLTGQPALRGGQLAMPIGLLLGLALLSVARGAALPTGYAYDGLAGLLDLFRSAMVFSGYFLCLAMATGETDRRRMSWAVLIGLFAEIVVTRILGGNGTGGRAAGTIEQPNELGAYLVAYTVFAAALIPGTRAWFGKLFLLGIVGGGCYTTFLTLSRGAYVALAAGILWVAFRTSRALFALALLVIATSPFWTPDFVKVRMAETQVQVEGSDEVQLEGSAESRIQTWRTILNVVSEHPLDGVGWSGIGYVLQDTGEQLGFSRVASSSHNTYLRLLGEMGVLGLAVLLFLLWRCFRLAETGLRAARSRFDRQLCIGLGGAAVTVCVSCWFGERFFNIQILGSFWILCALADDLVQERRREAT